MISLQGKHCLVTGGSRGIGLAIAQLFASQGAKCTLIARHQEPLTEAVKSLKQQQQHKTLAFDVSSIGGWDAVIKKDEPIDILVNAAGIPQHSFLFKTDVPQLEKVLDVNLKGTIYGCKTVIPKMMSQRSGCIINVSSLLAEQGGRGASVYAAAKAGVVALTRSLAWEVGRFGIRANIILPGYIQTDITRGMNSGELTARIPMGRLGLVEEVAEAAAFLASNSYAHNCVLNIDGGLSAA